MWPNPSCSGPWERTPRDTLDTVQQSIESLPFGFLKKVDPQNVLTFIIDEHPQTIALILSHLPPAYGAQIIGGLTARTTAGGDPPHRAHGTDQPGDDQTG